MRFASRVLSVGQGWIELERPLLYGAGCWVGWLLCIAVDAQQVSVMAALPRFPPLHGCPRPAPGVAGAAWEKETLHLLFEHLPSCAQGCHALSTLVTLLPLHSHPQPAVYNFTNPVQHSGFEGFTVRFAWCVLGFGMCDDGRPCTTQTCANCILLRSSASHRAPYPAHMKVEGMNGFWFYGCANAWVRNVHIINAE